MSMLTILKKRTSTRLTANVRCLKNAALSTLRSETGQKFYWRHQAISNAGSSQPHRSDRAIKIASRQGVGYCSEEISTQMKAGLRSI